MYVLNFKIRRISVARAKICTYDPCNARQISSPLIEYTELDPALCLELQNIVETLAAPGKGLLACDESPASLDERFQQFGLENTESTRRDYRQMLLSADKVAARDDSRNFRRRQRRNATDPKYSFDLGDARARALSLLIVALNN